MTGWILTKLGRNDPYMTLFKNCSNGSGPLHIKVTQAKNIYFQDETLKIFLSETTRPRALIFGMYYHLVDIYQVFSNYPHGAKNGPAPGITCFT